MIEPSKLISRMMTFVLAGCLTVLFVLVVTLGNMFPLERTQVFLMRGALETDQTVAITRFDVNRQNLEAFKENFIRRYITVRNEIYPSNEVMQRRWQANAAGSVYAYSSLEIYSEFRNLDMWNAVMIGRYEPLMFRCDVSFGRIVPRVRGVTYAVPFRFICTDESTGQSMHKDFTIAVTIAFQDTIGWGERLSNPLGLKVVGYRVESGGGHDPLSLETFRRPWNLE